MAGISHNAKNSNLPEFGDSVSAGSKALCGLTEAAAQVKFIIYCYLNINLDRDLLKKSTQIKTGWQGEYL